MGPKYGAAVNIYLLEYQLINIIVTQIWCLNIHFEGQEIQCIHFQNCICDGHPKIQDGRHGYFDFFYLFKK